MNITIGRLHLNDATIDYADNMVEGDPVRVEFVHYAFDRLAPAGAR